MSAEGIETALDQARRAARGKDVSLGGGANVAQQYLVAGLVDEMEISLVPTLLGSGERLFNGVGDDLHGLALVRTVATPVPQMKNTTGPQMTPITQIKIQIEPQMTQMTQIKNSNTLD